MLNLVTELCLGDLATTIGISFFLKQDDSAYTQWSRVMTMRAASTNVRKAYTRT